jgi:sugar porter (SP) family MFS transporter
LSSGTPTVIPAKMPPFVLLAAVSAAIAGLLFGYDTAVINGALVYLKLDFHLDSIGTELTATVLLWGCAVGAGLAGYVSDRFGRRIVLFAAGVLFCVSGLGAAFSMELWQLLVARVLGGLAIGCASLIAPLYLAEIAPAHVRGRLVTLYQLAIVIGILVAFVSNYRLAGLPHGNWRWMFGLGALPAFVLCLSLLWIPESPRWLLQVGRPERARAVLQRILPGDSVDSEIDSICRTISSEVGGSYRELLGKALRKPLVLTVMLAIIQQVTGINTVLYYGSIVFAEHAGTTAGQAIGMNILVGTVNFLLTILALVFIDRIGRRPLLLIATAGMGVCLGLFACGLAWLPGHPAVMLSAVLGYVAFFAFGLGPGVWVCLAEFFPNHIRGRAMSVATLVLWLAVSAVTATFLSLIQVFSAPAVFLGYAFICGVSFAYIWLRLPETKNRTLESIETLWQDAQNLTPGRTRVSDLPDPEPGRRTEDESL